MMTDAEIMQEMLYAVARDDDGTVDLTVYEDGNACCVTLNAAMATQLAGLLTGREHLSQSGL